MRETSNLGMGGGRWDGKLKGEGISQGEGEFKREFASRDGGHPAAALSISKDHFRVQSPTFPLILSHPFPAVSLIIMFRQINRIARSPLARTYASTRPIFGGVVTQVIGAVVDVKVIHRLYIKFGLYSKFF